MEFKKIKIATQLNIGLGLILLLVLILGASAVTNSQKQWESTDNLYSHALIIQNTITDIEVEIFKIRLYNRELVLETDQNEIQELITKIKGYETDVDRQMEILRKTYVGPISDVEAVEDSIEKYRSIETETIQLVLDGSLKTAQRRVDSKGVAGIQGDTILNNLKVIREFANYRAAQLYLNAQNIKNQIQMQRIPIVIISIFILSFAISIILKANIMKPLNELIVANSAFRSGKYKTRSSYDADNEFGDLSTAFNAMAATVENEIKKREQILGELLLAKEHVEAANKSIIHANSNLELANKELEAFSYSVSHDLKAPLRHINGYVALICKKYSDILPEDGRQYIENISTATRNMGELIDGLLQLSRTGRVEIHHKTVDMNAIINKLIGPIMEQDSEHRIRFAISSMPTSQGDPEMLQSVWNNLIENAVKFTKNKDMAEITIGSYSEGNHVVYFIKDNGAGFDMTYNAKLFTVFQRLHSKEDYDGTGIGLATVKRILTRHGGRVWAEGIIGEGATFYFTLKKRGEEL